VGTDTRINPVPTERSRSPAGTVPDIVRTPRLDLVTLELRDLEAIGSDDHGFAAAHGWHNPDGLLTGDEAWMGSMFARRLADRPSAAGWLARVMVERKSSTIVGHIGCHHPPSHDAVVEIGYTVGASRRGEGFATEAVTGLVDALAGSGVVREVLASTSPDNLASIRVLERVGFTRVGSGDPAGLVSVSYGLDGRRPQRGA